MAKINFYKIDKAEKQAIFNAIATEKGMTHTDTSFQE